MTYKFFVGCYTDDENVNGLNLFEFDTASLSITLLSSVNVSNPSYFAFSKNNPFLYCVNENHTSNDKITAIEFDGNRLTVLDEIHCGGSDPCYISINSNDNYLVAANYSDGSLSVVGLLKDGKLNDNLVKVIPHNIPSFDTIHKKSHMHATILCPDEKFLLAANLGLDTITVYEIVEYNPMRFKFILDCTYPLPIGTGPRHLIFSKDGRFVIAVGELDASVHVLGFDSGKLTIVQKINLMSESFDGINSAADIHFSINGRFIYVSNRGDANQIIVFSFDKNSGILTFVDRFSTDGISPRNFVLDPSGEFMLIANQMSDDVRLFKVDKESGKIWNSNIKLTIKNPVCIKFVEVKSLF